MTPMAPSLPNPGKYHAGNSVPGESPAANTRYSREGLQQQPHFTMRVRRGDRPSGYSRMSGRIRVSGPVVIVLDCTAITVCLTGKICRGPSVLLQDVNDKTAAVAGYTAVLYRKA